MIKRLVLKNFGPFESAEVRFDNFTAILGRNGAGKSLVFTALKGLGRVTRYPLRYFEPSSYMGGFPTRTGQVSFDDIVHKKDPTKKITLRAEFETEKVKGFYQVVLGHWHSPGGVLVEEELDVEHDGHHFKLKANEDGTVEGVPVGLRQRYSTPRFASAPIILYKSRDPKHVAIGSAIQEALAHDIGIYRFDPTALKTPAEVGRPFTPTGYGFAAYLDQIRNEVGGTEEFGRLLARFREVCPHVQDVLLPSEGPGSYTDEPSAKRRKEIVARKRIELVMPATEGAIPADLESDGTILLLAYASLLHGTRQFKTICIEEPENGVHPKVVPMLVKMLQQISREHDGRPGAQLLICTHSRTILDELKADPSSIRLITRAADGRSSIEHMSSVDLPTIAGRAGLAS
ncbi:MAG TPA: AAA family ATPase [Polyangia bacterium]|nr:AAA family ATPase [Polyangia bacterium]